MSLDTSQIIAKLQREKYETSDPSHSAVETAWRHGWNARADALAFDLSQGDVEAGLEELKRNAPHERFDTGGES